MYPLGLLLAGIDNPAKVGFTTVAGGACPFGGGAVGWGLVPRRGGSRPVPAGVLTLRRGTFTYYQPQREDTMEYIGYAGFLAAAFFLGAAFAAMRMNKAYKKLGEYADHLRAVLTATEKRYTDLSSENSRLRVKNHALQRTIEEHEETTQYKDRLKQA